MTDRAARGCLAAVLLALAGIAVATDLPAASSGRFWNDGATYYTMAWSLARDGDLVYENQDLERVAREYPAGPQGIFLKRASGGFVFDAAAGFPWMRRLGPSERRIYFAKAFAYPVAAAPLVWLFGTRGLLLTNALFLALFAGLGYGELRRHASPAASLGLVLALLFATVTPLYLFWPQPEIFNLGVLTAAIAAWRRDRILFSALLFGLATYSKPTNALLALPLGLAPLIGAASGRVAAALGESLRRGILVVLAAGALYGANAAITGEANYQGGERKTFYGTFAADLDRTFDARGAWMTTDNVGPVVTEHAAQARAIEQGVIVRAAREMRETFARNLGYFWIGRFAGAALYFLPVLAAAAFYLAAGPRDVAGLLALSTLLLSAVVYVWLIPDNWYGGGGTVGNRYFLNLVPLAFLLTPRGAVARVATIGSLGAVFVLPMFAAPIASSLEPWRHALRPVFRAFPAELTMLNDLSICADPWRKKQPFGDPEGDAAKGRTADPKAFWIYFPDDGTYGKEPARAEGFWTRGGASAELLLRALEPVRRMHVRVEAGPAGDVVTARAGDSRGTLVLQPHQSGTIELVPDRGILFYDSLLYVVRVSSRSGGSPGPADPRSLGSFVRIDLDVDRRER